ncbi:hypothetical protein DPEC_G00119970 [Dallia pectoralis]|uniref:Uncharacterized protein n=1 Tax=Dallia pectoralis TaxID=75939 RepID=A0ACC2GPQ3_DALPE|nr:hypothetical protein DPEC_G00119970 [Dallia pectoralis]
MRNGSAAAFLTRVERPALPPEIPDTLSASPTKMEEQRHGTTARDELHRAETPSGRHFVREVRDGVRFHTSVTFEPKLMEASVKKQFKMDAAPLGVDRFTGGGAQPTERAEPGTSGGGGHGVEQRMSVPGTRSSFNIKV